MHQQAKIKKYKSILVAQFNKPVIFFEAFVEWNTFKDDLFKSTSHSRKNNLVSRYFHNDSTDTKKWFTSFNEFLSFLTNQNNW